MGKDNESAKCAINIDNLVSITVAGCINKKLKHLVKEYPLFEYSFRIGYIVHQRKRVWGPSNRARSTVLGYGRMNKIEKCV